MPTLSTYAALADEGARLGWSAAMRDKLAKVQSRGTEAVRIAPDEGVPVAFGSDPTASLAMLSAPETGIRLLMQGGRTVRNSL